MLLTSSKSGGSGTGTLTVESPTSGSIDGSNKVFVFSHDIGQVTVNGAVQAPGGEDVTISPSTTATFVIAPQTGAVIRNWYIA